MGTAESFLHRFSDGLGGFCTDFFNPVGDTYGVGTARISEGTDFLDPATGTYDIDSVRTSEKTLGS